jgi:hypothetical protein
VNLAAVEELEYGFVGPLFLCHWAPLCSAEGHRVTIIPQPLLVSSKQRTTTNDNAD